MFFARIEDDPSGGPEKQRVRLEIVRTIVVGAIGAILVVGAIVLFAIDKNGAANTVLHFAEAFLFGGLGLAIGERRGAQAATERRAE